MFEASSALLPKKQLANFPPLPDQAASQWMPVIKNISGAEVVQRCSLVSYSNLDRHVGKAVYNLNNYYKILNWTLGHVVAEMHAGEGVGSSPTLYLWSQQIYA